MKRAAILVVLVAVLAWGGYAMQGELLPLLFQFQETPPPVSPVSPDPDSESEGRPAQQEDIAVVAENLEIPWEVAFLPSGDLLVTERPGRLVRIGEGTQAYPVSGVRHQGEGGLLGLALHPDFEENRLVYLYLTTAVEGGLENRVERYLLQGDQLTDRTLILQGIPGAAFHDGGRIAFGPDGYLYITTGDAGSSQLAQDTGSLAGKILRIGDDGSIPEDNPFQNAVYSYGHRNPQGLAWDGQGRLWSTEHGRSGVLSGLDELNLIEQGKNYGWPVIQGEETQEGMEAPVLQSGPDSTWAPASALYFQGSVFFGGLRGQALYEADVSGEELVLRTHFPQEFGRIRAAALGPDGMLYFTTSNRDGRGSTLPGDDKVIRVHPRVFRESSQGSSYVPPLEGELRAIYFTAWSASTPGKVAELLRLAETTSLNAVVVDIKDFSGIVAYDTGVEEAASYGAERFFIQDIEQFLQDLHGAGLYVIARVTVFQDPVLAKARPDLALSKESAPEELWEDRKGLEWMDPASEEVWEYNAAIARDALAKGFDEVNFDYVRFPTDGDLQDIAFPVWDGETPKRQVVSRLYKYLGQEVRGALSVDLFGLTAANRWDDMGIGQVLEDTFSYFDYVSPMLYPSHFAPGFLGFEDPASHPYEVVQFSLQAAQSRLEAFAAENGSPRARIRPWLQYFNLASSDFTYDREAVRAQIQASQDALGEKYAGYLLWNSRNSYPPEEVAEILAEE